MLGAVISPVIFLGTHWAPPSLAHGLQRASALPCTRTGVLLLQLDADQVQKQEEFAGLSFHFSVTDFKQLL